MKKNQGNQTARITSIVLIVAGLILLGITIFTDNGTMIYLPLIFLALGAAFILLVIIYKSDYFWAPWLYIPGCLLLTLGIIFLMNVLTGDWDAWAYAWLLIFPGAGLGTILANRYLHFPGVVLLSAQGAIILGAAFFAIFGAIAGGLFIQIMVPILLVVLGLSLRWSRISERIFRPIHREGAVITATVFPGLVEPLSLREIEVLQLINAGLTNAEIARRLTVAQSTVKTHINNIYTKMNVQSRVQAVNRAHELGILK